MCTCTLLDILIGYFLKYIYIYKVFEIRQDKTFSARHLTK